eukprot:TRINITY_DN172_c0_g1_i1.p1 TRINITY_DN172_c0_g1~~TRINITY_DN172_c0_g1_i1.p1  ORF type:complete len:383 (+),score=196.23 TRINITY_DN172_c0_g1_i1:208-1356(+)
MKIHDATFDTDIQTELNRIERVLRSQKLEQQWRKEGRGEGKECEGEMQQWIQQQLDAGACSEVQLKLPNKGRKFQQPAQPVVKTKNEDYDNAVAMRERASTKGPGDKVLMDRKKGLVLSNVDGLCEVRWDKVGEDGVEVSAVPADQLTLVSKSHPAMMITAESRPVDPRKASYRYKSNAKSSLAGLFTQPTGQSPSFLYAKENRKQQVERQLAEKRSKMVAVPAGANGSSSRRSGNFAPKNSNYHVQSRFLQAQPDATVCQIAKEAGERVEIVFDPDTLCLTEAAKGTASGALDEFRGMKITHVSVRDDFEEYFSNEEGIHSKEQLRKVLAKAMNKTNVAVRLEKWNQYRAIEKKKQEARNKMIVTKDKSKSGSKNSRPAYD